MGSVNRVVLWSHKILQRTFLVTPEYLLMAVRLHQILVSFNDLVEVFPQL